MRSQSISNNGIDLIFLEKSDFSNIGVNPLPAELFLTHWPWENLNEILGM